jgi:tetratricopeptide (TPR) repeat protein
LARLAYVLACTGQLKEAESIQRDLGSSSPQVNSDNIGEVLVAQIVLAEALHERGLFGQAINSYDAALDSLRRISSLADDPELVSTVAWLLINHNKDYAKVVEIVDETLAAMRTSKKSDPHLESDLMSAKATALRGQKKLDDAIALFSGIYALRKELLGEDNLTTSTTAQDLAFTLRQADRATEAISIYEQSIAALSVTNELPGQINELQVGLSAAYKKTGQYEQARKVLREAARHLPEKNATGRAEIAWSLATAREAEVRDGALARKLADEAAELTEHKNASILDTLAAACAETGDFDAAVQWEEKAIELSTAVEKQRFAPRLQHYRARKRWWVE